MTNQEKTNFKNFLQYQKENINVDLTERLWVLMKEDTIKLDGMILFAWQCDIIEYDEWKKYKEFIWEMRKIAEDKTTVT